MIVVIADDLTGAAEIAGIGLRYGLDVLLSADTVDDSDIDLLVIYTNTRSLPEERAVDVMLAITMKVAKLQPTLFYKKTDSLLRGHVLPELKAHLQALLLTKALLLPVNPLLGRTISDGNYYVNGRPVHAAGFANDPEFPILSSRVEDMLGVGSADIHVLKLPSHLPEGISVGEASSKKDVQDWASIDDKGKIFYAGAASFFAALLHRRFVPKKTEGSTHLRLPLLILSGTTFQPNIERQAAFSSFVSQMPRQLFHSKELDANAVQDWVNDASPKLTTSGKCIMTIGRHDSANGDPHLLRQKMSAAAKMLLQTVPVRELLIEGGSTAYAVMQGLGFTTFHPTEELQQGVVRMKVGGVEDLHLTFKPGSYSWPAEWEKVFAQA